LILIDIALPEISGIEVLKLIRNEPAIRHIPIIAVSASAMKGDHERFIAHGFDDYLSKPIDTESFERIIKKYSVD
jgi:two-component system cell cycle response regulator DivK